MTGTIAGLLSLDAPGPDRPVPAGRVSRGRPVVSGRLRLTTGGATAVEAAGDLLVAFAGGLPASGGAGATARAIADAWPRGPDRCLSGVPGGGLGRGVGRRPAPPPCPPPPATPGPP